MLLSWKLCPLSAPACQSRRWPLLPSSQFHCGRNRQCRSFRTTRQWILRTCIFECPSPWYMRTIDEEIFQRMVEAGCRGNSCSRRVAHLCNPVLFQRVICYPSISGPWLSSKCDPRQPCSTKWIFDWLKNIYSCRSLEELAMIHICVLGMSYIKYLLNFTKR